MTKKTTRVKNYIKDDGTAVGAHNRTFESRGRVSGGSSEREPPPAPPVDVVEGEVRNKNGDPNCVKSADDLSRSWIINSKGEFVFVGGSLFSEEKMEGWVELESGEYAWIGKNAYLEGVDLSGLNLSGAKLIEAELMGCDLSGCNLSKTFFANSKIVNCDLSNADLSGANVVISHIENSDLRNTNFSKVKLARTDFVNNLWGRNNMVDVEIVNIDRGDGTMQFCNFEKYDFYEAARLLDLSEKQFEYLVVSGTVEVRDKNSHAVVTSGFNVDSQYVPVWAIHDQKKILQ